MIYFGIRKMVEEAHTGKKMILNDSKFGSNQEQLTKIDAKNSTDKVRKCLTWLKPY